MRALSLFTASVRDLGLKATLAQLPAMALAPLTLRRLKRRKFEEALAGRLRRRARHGHGGGAGGPRARACGHSRRPPRHPLRDDQRGGDPPAAGQPRRRTSPASPSSTSAAARASRCWSRRRTLPPARRRRHLAGVRRRRAAQRRALRAGADRPGARRAPGRRRRGLRLPAGAARRLPLQPVPRRGAGTGGRQPRGEPARAAAAVCGRSTSTRTPSRPSAASELFERLPTIADRMPAAAQGRGGVRAGGRVRHEGVAGLRLRGRGADRRPASAPEARLRSWRARGRCCPRTAAPTRARRAATRRRTWRRPRRRARRAPRWRRRAGRAPRATWPPRS